MPCELQASLGRWHSNSLLGCSHHTHVQPRAVRLGITCREVSRTDLLLVLGRSRLAIGMLKWLLFNFLLRYCYPHIRSCGETHRPSVKSISPVQPLNKSHVCLGQTNTCLSTSCHDWCFECIQSKSSCRVESRLLCYPVASRFQWT